MVAVVPDGMENDLLTVVISLPLGSVIVVFRVPFDGVERSFCTSVEMLTLACESEI